MDTAAESSATAGGEPVVPVRLDTPRAVQAETDYGSLAEQARQNAFSHRAQMARQEGNTVT